MVLCIMVCVKMLPPMIMLVSEHVSPNLSPFSFISPTPWVPITSSCPVVRCNFRIEITHENGHILFSALVQDAL